jgi:hypothetical protein
MLGLMRLLKVLLISQCLSPYSEVKPKKVRRSGVYEDGMFVIVKRDR